MKPKAYIIRNREEFFAVNKLIGDYYEYDTFSYPNNNFAKYAIIIYSKSRNGPDNTPGWDFYFNVCDDASILNNYDVVKASTLLRKQKLIKLGI